MGVFRIRSHVKHKHVDNWCSEFWPSFIRTPLRLIVNRRWFLENFLAYWAHSHASLLYAYRSVSLTGHDVCRTPLGAKTIWLRQEKFPDDPSRCSRNVLFVGTYFIQQGPIVRWAFNPFLGSVRWALLGNCFTRVGASLHSRGVWFHNLTGQTTAENTAVCLPTATVLVTQRRSTQAMK